MTKHKWRGKVPLRIRDDKIVGLSPDGTVWGGDYSLRWSKWHTFQATLIVDEIVRFGHVARFQATDYKNERTYPLFMADLLDIMKRVGVEPGAQVKGTWGYCKRGSRYGIYLIGGNDVEKVD